MAAHPEMAGTRIRLRNVKVVSLKASRKNRWKMVGGETLGRRVPPGGRESHLR